MLGLPLQSTGRFDVRWPHVACTERKAVSSIDASLSPVVSDTVMDCPAAPSSLKVLLFGDSFGANMMPFFGAGFAHVRMSARFPTFGDLKRYVEAEHPDMVVEERVERYLSLPL